MLLITALMWLTGTAFAGPMPDQCFDLLKKYLFRPFPLSDGAQLWAYEFYKSPHIIEARVVPASPRDASLLAPDFSKIENRARDTDWTQADDVYLESQMKGLSKYLAAQGIEHEFYALNGFSLYGPNRTLPNRNYFIVIRPNKTTLLGRLAKGLAANYDMGVVIDPLNQLKNPGSNAANVPLGMHAALWIPPNAFASAESLRKDILPHEVRHVFVSSTKSPVHFLPLLTQFSRGGEGRKAFTRENIYSHYIRSDEMFAYQGNVRLLFRDVLDFLKDLEKSPRAPEAFVTYPSHFSMPKELSMQIFRESSQALTLLDPASGIPHKLEVSRVVRQGREGVLLHILELSPKDPEHWIWIPSKEKWDGLWQPSRQQLLDVATEGLKEVQQISSRYIEFYSRRKAAFATFVKTLRAARAAKTPIDPQTLGELESQFHELVAEKDSPMAKP